MKMKPGSAPLILFIAIVVPIISCAPVATETGATPQPRTTKPPVTKEGWESRWDQLVAEAKKEGTVVVYSLWRPETRKVVGETFFQKFGIVVDSVAFSRGAELLAKIQMEKSAGLKIVDVFGAGGPTLVGTVKPQGFLGNIELLLLLPEVMQATVWRGGGLPFLDKDRTAMGLIATPYRYILINTEMVKPGEVNTYRDVLNPKWKGKIVFNDPTVTGAGNGMLGHLARDIWNEEQSLQFLKDVLKQDPVITRDNRLQVEWVARGKNPVALAANAEIAANFLELGASLSFVIVKEGVFVSPGAGAFGVSAEPPHPNAAKLFINWLLSKEGQTAFVKGFGNPGTRLDVPLEGIDALFIPQPGEKLFLDSEEHILMRARLLKPAADIMAAAGIK